MSSIEDDDIDTIWEWERALHSLKFNKNHNNSILLEVETGESVNRIGWEGYKYSVDLLALRKKISSKYPIDCLSSDMTNKIQWKLDNTPVIPLHLTGIIIF